MPFEVTSMNAVPAGPVICTGVCAPGGRLACAPVVVSVQLRAVPQAPLTGAAQVNWSVPACMLPLPLPVPATSEISVPPPPSGVITKRSLAKLPESARRATTVVP